MIRYGNFYRVMQRKLNGIVKLSIIMNFSEQEKLKYIAVQKNQMLNRNLLFFALAPANTVQ